MAFPTQLFHTPLYHQEQLPGPGRRGPLRARLWDCGQSLGGGRGTPQENGVLSSLPGGQGRPHSEGKERIGQEVASPQPGPVCSSPPKGVSATEGPCRVQPSRPWRSDLVRHFPAFMICQPGPQVTQTNLPLLPALWVWPVLSPFGMPLPPAHPCPGHRPQDTGQGAEQEPQGEGWPRREGEDRGDEDVSQEAGSGSREAERAQPWGDKTGGLKSPKQRLSGPPPWNPQTESTCLQPAAPSLWGFFSSGSCRTTVSLHTHDLCIWVTND